MLARGPGAHPALVDAGHDETWSYRDLADEVGRIIEAVPGLRAGSLLFLPFRTRVEHVLLYLAALEAGCTIALIDPEQRADHRARLEDAYQPDLVAEHPPIASAGYVQTSTGPARVPLLWSRKAASDSPMAMGGTAVLLPTSGSTGNPKLVRLAWSALLANAEGIAARLAIGEPDVAITSLPLHYSYGLSVLNSHLAAGAMVVLTEASVLQPAFWTAMAEHRVTSLAGVPYSFEMYRRVGLLEQRLPHLMTLTQAGGRLAGERIGDLHRGITSRGGRLFVMYGQTEATARMSILDPGDLPDKIGSVGTVLPGGHLTIDDPDATGAGAVVYRGPNVMLGYAECRADLHRGDDLGGVLATGDIGRLDAEGRLWIIGRTKRIAKVFGERVNLDDIESLLIRDGPTAAIDGGDRIVLFCTWGGLEQFAVAGRALARQLGSNPRGFDFRRVDALPRLSSGKVAYAALRERL
jgi:acyl-coenzyme A synthetase/AMP-(fatty) acid ligase